MITLDGRLFIATLAGALLCTLATAGWAFAVQTFGLPVWASVMLGVAAPLAAVMAAMWAIIR